MALMKAVNSYDVAAVRRLIEPGADVERDSGGHAQAVMAACKDPGR